MIPETEQKFIKFYCQEESRLNKLHRELIKRRRLIIREIIDKNKKRGRVK